MKLIIALRRFIATYVNPTSIHSWSNYEDTLEEAIDKLYSLCTTDEERELVKAIVRLEDH